MPYEGKDASLDDWRKLVNIRSTQTLKFINLSRILKIIGYDPSLYMNPQKMNTLAKGKRAEQDASYYESFAAPNEANVNPRKSLIDTTRKNDVGHNLFQILAKYIKVD